MSMVLNSSDSFLYRDTLVPSIMPSLEMSVQATVFTPLSVSSFMNSYMSLPLPFVQPLVRTSPSSTSTPTAMCSPYLSMAAFRNSGSSMAMVPSMTLSTPRARYLSMVFIERIPPPTSTFREVFETIFSMTSAFSSVPDFAPSRSTRWSHSAPASLNSRAWDTGSSLYTVFLE